MAYDSEIWGDNHDPYERDLYDEPEHEYPHDLDFLRPSVWPADTKHDRYYSERIMDPEHAHVNADIVNRVRDLGCPTSNGR